MAVVNHDDRRDTAKPAERTLRPQRAVGSGFSRIWQLVTAFRPRARLCGFKAVATGFQPATIRLKADPTHGFLKPLQAGVARRRIWQPVTAFRPRARLCGFKTVAAGFHQAAIRLKADPTHVFLKPLQAGVARRRLRSVVQSVDNL
jgi:hypothetical protein